MSPLATAHSRSPDLKLLAWVEKSATAVSTYYGHFPVAEARVLIVPIPGHGVRRGTAFGYRGPALRLAIGTDSTEDDLAADWKAVHEMIHLALPDVTQDHLAELYEKMGRNAYRPILTSYGTIGSSTIRAERASTKGPLAAPSAAPSPRRRG